MIKAISAALFVTIAIFVLLCYASARGEEKSLVVTGHTIITKTTSVAENRMPKRVEVYILKDTLLNVSFLMSISDNSHSIFQIQQEKKPLSEKISSSDLEWFLKSLYDLEELKQAKE